MKRLDMRFPLRKTWNFDNGKTGRLTPFAIRLGYSNRPVVSHSVWMFTKPPAVLASDSRRRGVGMATGQSVGKM